MKESTESLKSIVDSYFQLKAHEGLLNEEIRSLKVELNKLSIKLENREASVAFLKNEINRSDLLKSNRDMMVSKFNEYYSETNELVDEIKKTIEEDRFDKRFVLGKNKKIKNLLVKLNVLGEKYAKKPLDGMSFHKVPDKLDLVQKKYVEEEVETKDVAAGYELEFQDVGLGAMEMELKIPQTEWEKLQRQVQSEYGQNYIQYCFGGKIRLLPRDTMLGELDRTKNLFKSIKSQIEGKKCVVIGNGPSLNKHDFSKMSSCFLIGSNYIFMNHKNMGFYPDIITASNYLVVEQRLQDFLDVPVPKLFPFYMYNLVGPQDNVYYLNVSHSPEFSENINLWASTRSTVTFLNLQISYSLGFEETYLIGVDNSYKQDTKKEGKVLNQEEDDPNHFSPEYFKGLKWQSADPDNMASVYVLAKNYFERSGKKIFNAGIGGALEVFERVDYADELDSNEDKEIEVNEGGSECLVVSINPDLQSYFGHYYQLDLKLSEFLSTRDDSFAVLSHLDVDLELNTKFPVIIPCFSEYSYTVGLRNVNEPNAEERFEVELRSGIEKLFASFPGIKRFEFYMYCGAFPHIRTTCKLLEEFAEMSGIQVRFHMHIFYPAFEKAFGRSTVDQGIDFFSNHEENPGLRLYAGTELFRSKVVEQFGVEVQYLPCFSTTFTDSQLAKFRERKKSVVKKVICFPGNLRPEKGMAVTLDSLFLMSEDPHFDDNRLVVRRFKREKDEDEVDYYKYLLSESIEWIDGELTDEEFQEMMADSDFIVIPYSGDAFEMRPSGLFSDSILLEKPVLVQKGTSMANFVQLYGNGEVYESDNAEDLVLKLKSIISNSEKLKLSCKFARSAWEKENSWDSFYKLLTN